MRVTRDAPGVSSDADAGCAEPERRRAEPSVRPGHAGVHGQCGERRFIGYGHGDGESWSSADVAQSPVNPVALAVGATPITLTVTAEDATTTMDVYRHGDA